MTLNLDTDFTNILNEPPQFLKRAWPFEPEVTNEQASITAGVLTGNEFQNPSDPVPSSNNMHICFGTVR
jgi:hypothetical protein